MDESERRNLADRLRPIRRWAGIVECAQVRLFGVSVLSLVFRQRVLVLGTTGRRSGKRRWTTVAYCELDGQVVVVGGAGGQTAVPDWVANLRADPRVVVSRRRTTSAMVAGLVTGAARDAMWQRLVLVWPMIVTYEQRAGRPIPVITLTAATATA